MGGSKKGEHRGNARKRPDPPGGRRYSIEKRRARDKRKRRHHETPGEIMEDAVSKRGNQCLTPPVVDRRIQVARIILGRSGTVEDTTPKEALLIGMRHNLQAYWDWIAMIEQWAQLPVTTETIAMIEIGERESERLLDKMGEFAFKVAGYIHPKQQTTAIINTDVSQVSVLHTLLEEIDELERQRPIPIEHKTRTG
jgi:hypothetical protein